MITILDGGMGQELIARSAAEPTALWSTKVLLDEPHLVRAVHDDFFAAGATVATTNSYAIHHDRLIRAGIDDQFESLHRAACEIACAARDAAGGGQVAGAIGPLVGSYRSDPLPEDAVERFAEVCGVQAPLVDLFLIETASTLEQVRATLAGAKGQGKPVWLAVSVDDQDGTKLRSGEPLEAVMGCCDGADALLINCATPEAVSTAVDMIKGVDLPFGAYANGFTGINPRFVQAGATVKELSARKDLTPQAYAAFAEDWAHKGATIIGGCCEVGPAHIAELARRLT
ncbi:homocysteine S-methyltransferase family protein [Pacificoceanicola onchidii]|uniref:homocysteine S-methyltransferase family protein n=1 Tax=Pacificoceanicola onchidii TaxID=2562685 RepID=UPI0010A58ABF|nr:homocysteine S-methyltransferase family protein [Pacificoceanicola onchidii]